MSKVLLLCGSLHKKSINQILLDAAASMAPKDVACHFFKTLADLPHYSQDLDTESAPAPIVALRRAIIEADGLVIAMPEYNHGIPGVLKNAIDWASRPRGRASLSGKAVVVLVATQGAGFGFQGHAQLRGLLADMENFVVPSPLVVVQRAHLVLRRDESGAAIFDDSMGRKLVEANWTALKNAMDNNIGQTCLVGSQALAEINAR